MPVQKPENTEVPTQQTLAYWMGRVDSKLSEMGGLIQSVINSDNDNWKDFRGWRQGVDVRLASGSEQFSHIERRLIELEETRCPLGESCPAVQSLRQHSATMPAAQPATPTKDESKEKAFGTWVWFRDGYIEKAVTIVVTLFLYKLIEIIIQNWGSLP